jgi:hypothetical protein
MFAIDVIILSAVALAICLRAQIKIMWMIEKRNIEESTETTSN